jgi:hypothetical protein
LLRLPAPADNAAMQTDPPKSDPPKRKRRWFQFSLRTLLIVVLIAAIPCAWLRSKIEQKRQERQTVEAILKSGGDVKYDYQIANPPATAPGLGWLRGTLGEEFFSEVVSVYIYHGFFDLLLWPKAADSQLSRPINPASFDDSRDGPPGARLSASERVTRHRRSQVTTGAAPTRAAGRTIDGRWESQERSGRQDGGTSLSRLSWVTLNVSAFPAQSHNGGLVP